MLELVRVIFIIGRYRLWSKYKKSYKNLVHIPLYISGFLSFIEIIFIPLSIESASFGEALCNALKDLGPLYIKLGQTLSTRPDIVGYKIANQLQDLQDKLPPFDTKKAIQTIELEFDCNIHDIFSSFNEVPVAASIAQVHKACLKDGVNVAVKVIRPDIKEKYAKNIHFFYYVANFLDRKYPRFKFTEIVDVFNDTMLRELDFLLEAASYSEMRDNFISDQTVYIPLVHWAVTSSKVLTTSWVDGESIYNLTSVVGLGIDPVELSKKVAVMFFNQSYRDGFFHADMHQGNIFIMPDGRIALIDFGIVGRLTDNDRLAVAEIIYGIVSRNYTAVAKTYLRAGYIQESTDIYLFAQHCRAICEPIAGAPLKDVSLARILEQMCHLTEKFGMSTQPQLILLQKSMVILEGIGKSLDDDINMWKLAEPWIKKWAAKNISPEAKLLRMIKHIIERVVQNY